MTIDTQVISRNRLFGGEQRVLEHESGALGCTMRLSAYLPPRALAGERCSVLIYLSGLTCTEQNVTTKAGAQRACADHGVVFICPDTSPRGEDVADDEGWDLGQGAGFYLTATRSPWAKHYAMDRYVMDEVLAIADTLTPGDAVSAGRVGITGHSMGGHGAITLGLKHAERFASISALAPILQPMDVPWGEKAFRAYLGDERDAWAAYDSRALVRSGKTHPYEILIDQGSGDSFLDKHLACDDFKRACDEAGQAFRYRLQNGYDHSYYFVASFIADHVEHHARSVG